MKGFVGTVIFILIIVTILFWPRISAFLRTQTSRFMARRAEDMMRRMMGMPSKREEERRKKAAEKQNRKKDSFSGSHSSGGSRRRKSSGTGARPYVKGRLSALLQAVAVDIDFVEIRDFSSTTVIADEGQTIHIQYEEQITDVKFTEIKGARP